MTVDTADSAATLNGFRISHTAELGQLGEAIDLDPGIVAYPVEWSSPKDGGRPLPSAAFVKFAPGARYLEPDVHEDSPEIVIVLSGLFKLGVSDGDTDVYGPHTRIEGRRGSSHTPSSPSGCLLYVTFPERT